MTPRTPATRRDYSTILRSLRPHGTRMERLRRAADALWDTFGVGTPGQGDVASPAWYSWVGFYEKVPGADEMVLLARRDKPACSPLGLHGCCGRAWRERRPVLVADTATLGADYIACDPLDRSEVVIPLFEADGACWGVLDVDSYQTNAFDDGDVLGLTALAEALGLSAPGHAGTILRL